MPFKIVTTASFALLCSMMMSDGLRAMEKKAMVNNRRLIIQADFDHRLTSKRSLFAIKNSAFDIWLSYDKRSTGEFNVSIFMPADQITLIPALVDQEAPILMHIRNFFNILANIQLSKSYIEHLWPWLHQKYGTWKQGKTVTKDFFPMNTDFLKALEEKNRYNVKKSLIWKLPKDFSSEGGFYGGELPIQNAIMYQVSRNFADQWLFFDVEKTPYVLLVPKLYLEHILAVKKENISFAGDKGQLSDKATGSVISDAVVGLKLSQLKLIDVPSEISILETIGNEVVFSRYDFVEYLDSLDVLEQSVTYENLHIKLKEISDKWHNFTMTSHFKEHYKQIAEGIVTLKPLFDEVIKKKDISKEDVVKVKNAIGACLKLVKDRFKVDKIQVEGKEEIADQIGEELQEWAKKLDTPFIKKFDEYKDERVFDVPILEKCLITKADKDSLRWSIFWAGHGFVSSQPEASHMIAGTSAESFKKILAFFNNKMDLNFLFYETCFGGSPKSIDEPYRQFENESNTSKATYNEPLHFPVAENATTEFAVTVYDYNVKTKEEGDITYIETPNFVTINGIILPPLSHKYREFFNAIENFKSFKDVFNSIVDINIFMTTKDTPNNIVLLRLRGGKFAPVDIDKRVDVLTNVKTLAWLINHPEEEFKIISNKIALLLSSSVVPFGITFDPTNKFQLFELIFMGSDEYKYVEVLTVDSINWFFDHFVRTVFPRYLYVESLYISVDATNGANDWAAGTIDRIVKDKFGTIAQKEGKQYLYLKHVIITNNTKELSGSIRLERQGMLYEIQHDNNTSQGKKFNVFDRGSLEKYEKKELFTKFNGFKAQADVVKAQADTLRKIHKPAKMPQQAVVLDVISSVDKPIKKPVKKPAIKKPRKAPKKKKATSKRKKASAYKTKRTTTKKAAV